MGHKVHPHGLRVGIIRNWEGRWIAGKEYASLLHEDIKLRKHLRKKLANSGLSSLEIERKANHINIIIHTARPGMVIGRGGAEVEQLRKELEQMTGKQVHLDIREVRTPELDAQLVAENIAFQLERRISFRRAMRQAISRAVKMGAQGIKTMVAGRLGGAEIARTEWAAEGKVPLHTLRADVQYGFAEANTTYGKIGVKVWIYKGEVLPERTPAPAAARRGHEGGE